MARSLEKRDMTFMEGARTHRMIRSASHSSGLRTIGEVSGYRTGDDPRFCNVLPPQGGSHERRKGKPGARCRRGDNVRSRLPRAARRGEIADELVAPRGGVL